MATGEKIEHQDCDRVGPTELRESRAGLTQRALAEHPGKARSEIAKIELVPHDEHDERLVDAMLLAPIEQRLDSLEELSDFFASSGRRMADPGTNPPLRPKLLLEALVRHDVRFIILGGIAERLLGSPRVTEDFDICPETTRSNLERLANVLNEIGARRAPRGLEDVGFDPVEPWNVRSFGSHTSLALITPYGRLDAWLLPTGTRGYGELVTNAVDLEVHGLAVKVVGLDDTIRIKRAIGSPRYLEQIRLLRDLERRRREQGLDTK